MPSTPPSPPSRCGATSRASSASPGSTTPSSSSKAWSGIPASAPFPRPYLRHEDSPSLHPLHLLPPPPPALPPTPACQEAPRPAPCPLDAALDGVSQRLDTILADLRRSYPDTDIVLLAYPNFFSGTGHVFEAPAARVLPRLGDTVRAIASRHDKVAA